MKLYVTYARLLSFIILILNPVLSLLLDGTNIHFFYILGPIVMALVLLTKKSSRRELNIEIAVVVFVAVTVLISAANGSPLGKLNNHLFNYLDAVLLFIHFSREETIVEFKDYFVERAKVVEFIIVIINLIEAYYLMTHQGYVYIYSWGGNFFQGRSNMPHTLAYLMLLTILLSIGLMIVTRKKWLAVLTIVPTIAVFLSGARVALAANLILVCIVLSFVFTEKQKNIVLKVIKLIPLMAVAAFLLKDKIMSSNFYKKLTIRNTSGNVSAGRAYMVSNMLDHYVNDSKWYQYFIGQGDDKTYYYNSINRLVGTEVWAHNDLLQIIVGKGIIGIIFYLGSFLKFVRSLVRTSGNIYTLAFSVYMLMLMVLNGFYSYRDSMLSIPLIAMLNLLLSYKKVENN